MGRVNLSPKHSPSAVASTLKFQPEIQAFDDVFSSVLGRKTLQRNKTIILMFFCFFLSNAFLDIKFTYHTIHPFKL